jgi:putative DNA primase/helicase
MTDALSEFRTAMQAHGLIPPEHIHADGRIHRCDVEGKNGRGDGAYLYHADGVPAGGFQNWQAGAWQDWCAKSRERLSKEERAALSATVERARREREREIERRHSETGEQARRLWREGKPATAHAYLARKGITAPELRENRQALTIAGVDCQGALMAPIRDRAGTLQSLEFITADGRKLYLPGGRITGCYFSIRGEPETTLVIAEGVATAYSVHSATGYPVACAFSAGNLSAVAMELRAKFPTVRIIIAADNDAETDGNPGLTKARAAAAAVGGYLSLPEFEGRKVDFNDLALAKGADAVKEAIEAAQPACAEARSVDDGPRVRLIAADTIEAQPIAWLWPGWLAKGKLHILAGAPGTGKTTIALHLAACVSAGTPLPNGWKPPRGRVLIWSGEDDLADGLVPRLQAAGADMSQVHFVGAVNDTGGSRAFDPAHDVPELMTALNGIDDLALIVIDPLVSAVHGDSHKNAEVRRCLAPLVELAQAKRAALIGITHYSKGTQGREPLERVSGSLAFGALARLVYGTVRQLEEDDRPARSLLVRVKSNIGPDGGGFVYTVARHVVGEIETSRIDWGEAVEGAARELLAEAEEQPDAADDSKSFLRNLLAGGSRSAKEVYAEAEGAGYSRDAMKRAKGKIGVIAKKQGMAGGWHWSLPAAEGSEERTQERPLPSHPSGHNALPSADEVEAFEL